MIPTPPRSDRELLASYVGTGDSSAFTALTERHLGLVFGVACRRTQSREMAQEAAQNTFCKLARQASSLRDGSSLASWLHTVALREAGALLRAEAVRQRALQRLSVSAAPAVPLYSPPPPAPPGSEHLDGALAALPEAARRVLVLRYLQGMTLREVAMEENTSEEAARKRVTRALDRLTRLLARRGVTTAGVTACLAAAPMLCPAPSSGTALAARAVRQAAAPAAETGLSGLAGFALGHWPVAAVFLLAAVPAAWPWRTGGRGPHPDNRLRQEAAPPLSDGKEAHGNATAPPAGPPVIAGFETELKRLREGGRQYRDMRRLSGNLISRIGFGEWRVDAARIAAVRNAVLDFSLEEVKAAAALLDGETSGLIGGVLFSRWAELDPEAALRAALTCAERTESQEALLGVLSVRALKDPAGAVLWAWEHAPENLQEYSPGERRRELIQSLLEPLLATDPQACLRLMTSAPLAVRNIQPNARTFSMALPYDPSAALNGLRQEETRGSLQPSFAFSKYTDVETLQPAEAEVMASFAGDLPKDSALRRECLRTAVQIFARTDFSRAADLLVSTRPAETDEDRDWMAQTKELLRDWKGTDPAAAVRWLRTDTELPPDVLSDLARSAGLPSPSLIIPNPPPAP